MESVPGNKKRIQTLFDAQRFKLFDAIVVGAGFAGAVAARQLAEVSGRKVAVIEKRSHLAGNAYDHLDEQGVRIHAYGPHIFHTAHERVFRYLSRFTDWRDYEHEVQAYIYGSYVPVPFNLNSVRMSFDEEKARSLTDLLLGHYGKGARIPIIELRKSEHILLKELAEYVYENVFLHYTVKQWGLKPEEIDPAVTARVPVLVDWDDRYFQDPYQGMPRDGYDLLFKNMLNHPGIEVFLDLDACNLISFSEVDAVPDRFQSILIDGELYNGIVIYTGALDELCGERFGLLPYRSLDFNYRRYGMNRVQPCGTVNYTVDRDYTRTSEYTWLTGQKIDKSTIAEEYPRPYTDPLRQIPYYPVINEKNLAFYQQYADLFSELPNFHVLGRLAEYRYYNMDQIVLRALELTDEINSSR